MSRASRATAFCRLAVLVAEGLPAPRHVGFHPDGTMLDILLFDEDAFDAWSDAVDAKRDKTIVSTKDKTIFQAHNSDWLGYFVDLRAYTDHAPTVIPPDEVFDKVREIATADTEEPS